MRQRQKALNASQYANRVSACDACPHELGGLLTRGRLIVAWKSSLTVVLRCDEILAFFSEDGKDTIDWSLVHRSRKVHVILSKFINFAMLCTKTYAMSRYINFITNLIRKLKTPITVPVFFPRTRGTVPCELRWYIGTTVQAIDRSPFVLYFHQFFSCQEAEEQAAAAATLHRLALQCTGRITSHYPRETR